MASVSSGENTFARGILIPGLVAVGAIAVAILGALLIRGDGEIDDVNLFVESLSGNSAFISGRTGSRSPSGIRVRRGSGRGVQPVRIRHAAPRTWAYISESGLTSRSRLSCLSLARLCWWACRSPPDSCFCLP